MEELYNTPGALSIYDAIVKRFYLTNYGIKPEEVDRIPDKLLQIWNKIAIEEKIKRGNTQ